MEAFWLTLLVVVFIFIVSVITGSDVTTYIACTALYVAIKADIKRHGAEGE